MVPIINQTNSQIIQNEGLIIELVGLAGAGKSTLFKNLNETHENFQGEFTPQVWVRNTVPFYILRIINLFPLLLNLVRNQGRFISRRELAFLAILDGWDKILLEKKPKIKKEIFIDQGPISLMAYLALIGSPRLQGSNIIDWWEKIFEKWSKVLDIVIWLDTDLDTLIHRIHNRPQDHTIKYEPNSIACEWLLRYRSEYDLIIKKLLSYNPELKIIKINSGEKNVEDIRKITINEINKRKNFLK